MAPKKVTNTMNHLDLYISDKELIEYRLELIESNDLKEPHKQSIEMLYSICIRIGTSGMCTVNTKTEPKFRIGNE